MKIPAFLPFCRLCFCILWGTGIADAEPFASVPASRWQAALGESTRELHDLAYVRGGHDRQKLDLYLPRNASGKAPLVVFIHGGGWTGGDKGGCPAKWLVMRGYAVASLNYRFSQDALFPAQIEDCKTAIRWLRAHAAEYGIDPARIGTWGMSAGGHLVALLGTTGSVRDFDSGENLGQSSRVSCVVDWFGPTDFVHYGDPPLKGRDVPESPLSKLIGGTVGRNLEKAQRASPVTFVEPNAAPFLIMHGAKDDLVPEQQSELLSRTLQKAGVESTLKVLPEAGHGGPQFFAPANLATVVQFFDRHLGSALK